LIQPNQSINRRKKKDPTNPNYVTKAEIGDSIGGSDMRKRKKKAENKMGDRGM